jgi:hypothetical protein
MQRLRYVAVVVAGLPHQRLGEWCCGAKCVKSAMVIAR